MGRLFWKILLGLWLTLSLTVVAVGLLVHWHAQARVADLDALAAGPRADFAVASIASSLAHGGPEAVRELMAQWPGRRAFPVFAVDDQGRDLAGRTVPESAWALARERLAQNPTSAGVRRVQAPNGTRYTLFVPSANRHTGAHGGRSARDERFYLSLAATLVASMLFSLALAWYLSRPVRHLRHASRRLAAGELDTRVGAVMGRRRDEIADLGRDFDFMAARLQALVSAQRTLLHDVSHELRSPLARLQVAVGLARQQPDKTPAMLTRIEREAERLDELVGEVLSLSRLEAGVGTGAAECLELTALLETVVEDARFEAAPGRRSVTLDGLPAVMVMGHPELLRRAFDNVLRNAIRHTAPGTEVSVEVTQPDPATAQIRFCDRGPGVAESELATVFEPFMRSRGAEGPGFGLGLAIARRAVEVHGGRIIAGNREGGGMCVEVRLPAGCAGL